MRALLLISCAALGLAACGGANDAEDANMADANLMMEENVALDPTLNADANLATGTDPATQDLVNQDLTTNSADANLANGL